MTFNPGSILEKQLRAEIDLGVAMAADPANANLPDLALRVTSVNSPWFTRTCRVCHHKFREGDQVRICPQCGQAYHDDNQYGLHCWQKKFAAGHVCKEGGIDRFSGQQMRRCDFTWSGTLPDEVSSTEAVATIDSTPPDLDEALVNQFVTGVEKVWRPFGEQPVIKVKPGSALVGRICPWCRFQVRASDWVVACPCGCGTYFHQDVFRHLTCWNEWNGVEGNDFCPTTGRSYSKAGSDDSA